MQLHSAGTAAVLPVEGASAQQLTAAAALTAPAEHAQPPASVQAATSQPSTGLSNQPRQQLLVRDTAAPQVSAGSTSAAGMKNGRELMVACAQQPVTRACQGQGEAAEHKISLAVPSTSPVDASLLAGADKNFEAACSMHTDSPLASPANTFPVPISSQHVLYSSAVGRAIAQHDVNQPSSGIMTVSDIFAELLQPHDSKPRGPAHSSPAAAHGRSAEASVEQHTLSEGHAPASAHSHQRAPFAKHFAQHQLQPAVLHRVADLSAWPQNRLNEDAALDYAIDSHNSTAKVWHMCSQSCMASCCVCRQVQA